MSLLEFKLTGCFGSWVVSNRDVTSLLEFKLTGCFGPGLFLTGM